MTKNTGIFIRLNRSEKKHFVDLAQKSGLSISEYVRLKMLEKTPTAKLGQITEHKRDMTAFTTYGFFLLKRIAEKQLSEAELAEAKEKMLNALEAYKMQERK